MLFELKTYNFAVPSSTKKIELARILLGHDVRRLFWASVVPKDKMKHPTYQCFSSGHIEETLGYLGKIADFNKAFGKQLEKHQASELFNQVSHGVQEAFLGLSETERCVELMRWTYCVKVFWVSWRYQNREIIPD